MFLRGNNGNLKLRKSKLWLADKNFRDQSIFWLDWWFNHVVDVL
ncbi:hypothetical protein HMPREF0495_02140 [Levilactobacillus brevis ATCC 14869 = DSM 20054]|uniref:Uncharacterized protein n=1 Tax=Levilactobacillus brevis ATCC 14869 = DSM 20054 TaxID=649758 RepID=U2QK59_LEVBR|nr:hypothetical protein HMPREF0495_02140 [Levilactobacillus brevis ATCC 14869 = DSM 20054]KID41480.1 hypothetical protein LbDm2_2744 [Levilactobacillus brevis]KIO95611.1 hypothetical protein N624_1725 [Levilactobacillus brevis]KIO99473.1 hypothetical protein QP38_2162 [Levilactobacillus brevis]KIP00377.1 hypothetical protein N627_0795 [Levilactobacillus brevis]